MEKNIIISVLSVVVILLALLLIFNVPKAEKENTLEKDEVAELAMDYIQNELAPGTKFEFVKAEEDNGLYRIDFTVMDEQNDSAYVSKTGKYLFFQPYIMIPDKVAIPEVDLYVMSFCPYGNQAEELMDPVQELFKDKIDLDLHYIFYNDYATGYPEYCLDEEALYCSMHGIQELNQGIRELCVQKYQPDKLWDFVMAINEQTDYENVDNDWRNIGNSVGIDINKIAQCQEQEAMDLASQETELTKQFGISGSPTIIINGQKYTGQRTSDAYKEAICRTFKVKPSECDQKLTDNSASPGTCE